MNVLSPGLKDLKKLFNNKLLYNKFMILIKNYILRNDYTKILIDLIMFSKKKNGN